MNTNDLIRDLSRDLSPVRRLPSPERRLAWWLAASLPALAAAVALFGLRPDLAQCLADNRFVIGNAAAALTALAAAWATLSSTVPGCDRKRLAAPLLPALLWLAHTGAGCWTEWQAQGWTSLDAVLQQKCLPEIVAAGVLPATILLVLTRRGAVLAPVATAALGALAAAAAGSVASVLFHQGDTAWVTLTWHVGGVALLSGLSALAGPVLFRRPARFPPA